MVGCYLRKKDLDTCYEHLHELGSLATTYGFEIAFKAPCSLRKIEVSTYLGKGKLTELIEQALQCEAEIIIFDERYLYRCKGFNPYKIFFLLDIRNL